MKPNLFHLPFLPVVGTDGRHASLSLCECFEKLEHIADLDTAPHERIAITRFLLALAHAALDGPADRAELATARSRIPTAVLDYLAQNEAAFEVLGGYRLPHFRRGCPRPDDGDAHQ